MDFPSSIDHNVSETVASWTRSLYEDGFRSITGACRVQPDGMMEIAFFNSDTEASSFLPIQKKGVSAQNSTLFIPAFSIMSIISHRGYSHMNRDEHEIRIEFLFSCEIQQYT